MAGTDPRAAVWAAAALLHREHPDRDAFEVEEIQDRAGEEGLVERPDRLEVHATVQCVANMRPDPGTERYLYAAPDGRRRLFRSGDDYHPDRVEGPVHPEAEALPEEHRGLVAWYEDEYDEARGEAAAAEAGSGPSYGYKVLRASSAKEAEAALARVGADGWRLREAVPVDEEGPGTEVWLVLEREV